MRTDSRTRMMDKVKHVEDLAKIYHDEYRKDFVAPDWNLTSWEYRHAVMAGVAAVVEELNKRAAAPATEQAG